MIDEFNYKTGLGLCINDVAEKEGEEGMEVPHLPRKSEVVV